MTGCFGASRYLRLDDDRTFLAPCLQLSRPSSAIPSMAKAHPKALGQEVEDVEDGRLATAVGTEKHGQRRDARDLYVLERAVVLDSKRFDPGWPGRNSASGVPFTPSHASPPIETPIADRGHSPARSP